MRESEVILKITENYGLLLPEQDESYNVDDFNENFKTIDANMGGKEDLTKLETEHKDSLVDAINEVFQHGGDVKQKIVDAIKTADSTISISTDNTYEEICTAIIKIATNWVAKDKENRKMIALACNQAETTNIASLGMYASWENIKSFILTYLTNG